MKMASDETNGVFGEMGSIKGDKGYSPFFHWTPAAQPGSLAILHLRRDSLLPVTLRDRADDGYVEGAVTNTRFGSFPHSTIMGLDWGSQVKASKVDTGSRGRKGLNVAKREDSVEEQVEKSTQQNTPRPGKKRKSEEDAPESTGDSSSKKAKRTTSSPLDGQNAAVSAPTEAGSGFTHILPPTPESWTLSLDHRTQVVYTPDSSYILQRLRVWPGCRIIEAGAGSGSFTHAAARAVFNGYLDLEDHSQSPNTDNFGKVYSYEYHEPRVHTLRKELQDHGLDSIVTLTHRDVYNDGFTLSSPCSKQVLPKANAIFLDLPAPWLALPHLTRNKPNSPLDPETAIHLCTFSPCIEQVISTTSYLRKNGWTNVEMVEVANKRIDVRREQVGLHNEGLRGVNPSPATVEEAIGRLREVEAKLSDFHSSKEKGKSGDGAAKKNFQSKQDRLAQIALDAQTRKSFKEGNLVHRTEPEVKTHTSYLVFAILPREWTEADERVRMENWAPKEHSGKLDTAIQVDDTTA